MMTEESNTCDWRFCVAPMMDWTDRHCRYFMRVISKRARLYTEMITAPALVHGDVPRHLDFDPAEHPVALQLGGSDPAQLAHAARLGERWHYDEINLNCGCPSERVQTGSFGACLMADSPIGPRSSASSPSSTASCSGAPPITIPGCSRTLTAGSSARQVRRRHARTSLPR